MTNFSFKEIGVFNQCTVKFFHLAIEISYGNLINMLMSTVA